MTDRKIPAPLYAAAGAGDLAYQELRKISERLAAGVATTRPAELRERATQTTGELRERATATGTGLISRAGEFKGREDLDKIREAALRNAAAVLTGVQAAQARANAVYTDLIARGERVVRGAGEATADAALSVAASVESATDREVAVAEAETAVARKSAKAAATTAKTDARIAKAKADDATAAATKPVKRTRAPRSSTK
jgi:heparin binding hemagglutinin HbhA